jgi:hypothetical protein
MAACGAPADPAFGGAPADPAFGFLALGGDAADLGAARFMALEDGLPTAHRCCG